jgi:mannose-6-phosphate isomerase
MSTINNTFIPYPLQLESALFEKIWGGSAISALKQQAEDLLHIGESWEIYSKNYISHGAYAGLTLEDVIQQYPLEMIGYHHKNGEFPLLVKLLDAREWLSVQVHPDDTLADVLEGEPRGKTECWYILKAEPDAEIIYGLKNGISKQQYQYALNSGNDLELLHKVKVQKGDFIFVPAGTIHAIGPGIVLYELQQTSDTTYRLYDWDRCGIDGNPRELHIEKGIISMIEYASNSAKVDIKPIVLKPGIIKTELISSQYFCLSLFSIEHAHIECSLQNKAGLITVIGDEPLILKTNQGDYIIKSGYSAFVPAALKSIVCSNNSARKTEFLFAQQNI